RRAVGCEVRGLALVVRRARRWGWGNFLEMLAIVTDVVVGRHESVFHRFVALDSRGGVLARSQYIFLDVGHHFTVVNTLDQPISLVVRGVDPDVVVCLDRTRIGVVFRATARALGGFGAGGRQPRGDPGQMLAVDSPDRVGVDVPAILL